jgi:hypothetical protein
MNFHIFVLISSILFYIFLRYYKYNILTSKSCLKSKSKRRRNKKQRSNLIYALFLPMVLYVFYYIFIYKPQTSTSHFVSSSPNTHSVSAFSDDGLSRPYPVTASDTISSIY